MPDYSVMQQFAADDLDIQILQLLAKDAKMPFKQIAESLDVDQRTVAKRINCMREKGVIRDKVEIDWSRLGLGISAYIGSETGLGQRDVAKLYEFIAKEPRVIAAYETIGDEEYFLQVVEENVQSLRTEVLRPLEPLTADLRSSIISSKIKNGSDIELLQFIRKRKFPSESGPRMSRR